MYKFAALLLALSFTLPAAAAGTGTGKVTGYLPYSSGTEEMFFVRLETQTTPPSCNTTQRFAMKSSDPKFKATQAAVLAALMAGTPVTAKGAGTCNNFSNAEDLSYICVGTIAC